MGMDMGVIIEGTAQYTTTSNQPKQRHTAHISQSLAVVLRKLRDDPRSHGFGETGSREFRKAQPRQRWVIHLCQRYDVTTGSYFGKKVGASILFSLDQEISCHLRAKRSVGNSPSFC